MGNLKKRAFNGVFWTFLQQFSLQIVNLGVQILLARLLSPEMFGLIAMIAVFIAIGYTLMDGGMTSSLIRTKKPDQLDYSTVFFTNILVSVFIYIFIFCIAPLIAEFYNKSIIKNLLRVFSFTFVVRSLAAVHLAKLTKELDFKTQMKLEVPASIISGAIAVIMAYLGYGVWSLVGLNVANTVIVALSCWLFIKWKPTFSFNKEKFKYHFNFGYKMTLSGLLDTVYRNIYNIAIGKTFMPTTVGYFNQAETMRNFPVNQITTVMGKVTYPLFAELNSDSELKDVYKKIMKMVFFIVVPIMMMLIVSGKEFFLIVFGEKWLPAVPYFQILGFASVVGPLSTYNLNVLKVKGRSDLFLKLEVIKKIIGFATVFIAIPFGIFPLVVSYMVTAYLFTFLNMIYSGRLIGYGFWEQCRDCTAIFLIGIIAFIVSFYFRKIFHLYNLGAFISFVLVSLSYMVVYLPAIFWRERGMVLFMVSLLKK